MTLFSRLVQTKIPYNANSLAPLQGFHPGNPGNLSDIRTAPLIASPKPFTPPEAETLEVYASQRKQVSEATQKALKALSEVESLDAKDLSSYRKYQESVAKAELTKQQATAGYLTTLNNQRPAYAEAAAQVMGSHQVGNQELEILEARTAQILKGWKV